MSRDWFPAVTTQGKIMGEFYKMEYDAWDEGTVDLSLEEEAAYLRLCHQIYRRKGPVLNSAKLLCSIWRCHANRARRLLTALLQSGKISFTEDRKLTNERASVEIANRASKGQPNLALTPPQTPTKPPVTQHQTPTKLEFASRKPLKSLNAKTQIREEKKRKDSKIERASARVPQIPLPDNFAITAERAKIAVDRGLDADQTFSRFVSWAREKDIRMAGLLGWEVRWVRWCSEQNRSTSTAAKL